MYQKFQDNSLVSSGVCCNSLVVTETEVVIVIDVLIDVNFAIDLVSDKERDCTSDDVTIIDDDKEEKDGEDVLMDVVSIKLAIDVSDKWNDGINIDDGNEEGNGKKVSIDVITAVEVADEWNDVKDDVTDNGKNEEEDEDRDITWGLGSEMKCNDVDYHQRECVNSGELF